MLASETTSSHPEYDDSLSSIADKVWDRDVSSFDKQSGHNTSHKENDIPDNEEGNIKQSYFSRKAISNDHISQD